MKIVAGTWVLLGAFFCVVSVQADVGIGTQVITTGTEIKVLEPGPDLQAIIDEISDAGPEKPYLIKLGPGVYPITANPAPGNGLAMAPYVSIVGSGRGVTVLKGPILGASNTVLSDLSVDIDGVTPTLVYSIQNNSVSDMRIERVEVFCCFVSVSLVDGISNIDSSLVMNEVTIRVVGQSARGLATSGTSSLALTDVAISSSATEGATGVSNRESSSVKMSRVTVRSSGFFSSNGIVNSDSSTTMLTDVTITATGAPSTRIFGVTNRDSSTLTMTGVTSKAFGGDLNYGVYHDSASATSRIDRSSLSGSSNALFFGGSVGTRISNSQLVGGIDADPDPATVQCRDTYDEDLADVAC